MNQEEEHMNSLDRTIRYFDLKMIVKDLDEISDYPIPNGYFLDFYQKGDRDSWISIEQSAREFLTFEEGCRAWEKYYARHEHLLGNRMMFLVDQKTGEKIGTATAFFNHHTNDETDGFLHWVAIKQEYQGRGLSKPLTVAALKHLRQLGYRQARIPTQTTSWVAVKIYLDLGAIPENLEQSLDGYRIIKTLTNHPSLSHLQAMPFEEILDSANVQADSILKKVEGVLDYYVDMEEDSGFLHVLKRSGLSVIPCRMEEGRLIFERKQEVFGDAKETNRIEQLRSKPSLYEPGTSEMWTDPYIQPFLLKTHLDPFVNVASRSESNITSTVSWILVETDFPLSILDLGCGPGLYAIRFAKKGHHVVGIDFSEYSLMHAQKTANKEECTIAFINGNYLDVPFPKNIDLAVLIFCDFGVLSKDNQKKLLLKIHDSLKPGGLFVVDAYNELKQEKLTPCSSEEIFESAGFWRPNAHRVLYDLHQYPESFAFLEQYIVVDEQVSVYRFYNHYYCEKRMIDILQEAGFCEIKVGRNVVNEPDVTFYKARKI